MDDKTLNEFAAEITALCAKYGLGFNVGNEGVAIFVMEPEDYCDIYTVSDQGHLVR